MTRVTILPLPAKNGEITYHALAGNKESTGKTAGEALDSLSSQLPVDETGTMIIVQKQYPDQFFGQEQQRRLAQLMDEWREARDRGNDFPHEKLVSLRALVDAELEAATQRASAIFNE